MRRGLSAQREKWLVEHATGERDIALRYPWNHPVAASRKQPRRESGSPPMP
jgi:hypothetical protein